MYQKFSFPPPFYPSPITPYPSKLRRWSSDDAKDRTGMSLSLSLSLFSDCTFSGLLSTKPPCSHTIRSSPFSGALPYIPSNRYTIYRRRWREISTMSSAQPKTASSVFPRVGRGCPRGRCESSAELCGLTRELCGLTRENPRILGPDNFSELLGGAQQFSSPVFFSNQAGAFTECSGSSVKLRRLELLGRTREPILVRRT